MKAPQVSQPLKTYKVGKHWVSSLCFFKCNLYRYGLASLYQLRGRVGRAGRQAYAYMFHAEMSAMREEARERLLALEECCGLGEGFKLAERDMAIRGVGTIFGDKQSGEVDSIGADLYLELLYNQLEKIEKLRWGCTR